MNALTQPQRYLAAAQGLDPSVQVSTPDYVSLYTQLPEHWEYDINPGSGNSRATYLGELFYGGQGANNRIATIGDIAAATTGVSSFNTRTGAVVLTTADITGAGGAPAASPSLSGVPLTPTAAPGTSTGQIASTAFVTAAIGSVTAAMVSSFNGRTGAINLTTGDITTAGGAPLNSPAMTGTPTVPTAAVGNASSQVASTQFVANAIAGAVVSWNGRTGNVTMTLSDVTSVGGAPISSPSFTGTPVVPTAAPNTSTGQAASTAFVMNAITASTGGVASFNGRSGAVTLTLADVEAAGGAPIVSPAFTSNPTAPTQTAGTSNTTLATTAFVQNAITGLPGVASFNGRQGAVTLQLTDVTSVGGAPLASPNFSGNPTTTTPPPADNSTRVADTAFVTAAIAAIPASGVTTFNTRSGAVTLAASDVAGVGGQLNLFNNCDNSGFAINQRSYVSGTALAAGVYGLDRWKAGASGCTLTFATITGPSNTITITAGSLQQVIDGAALAGGNYMLSWAGTAQGRVGAGTYATSPVAVTGIAAGANTTIEFNAGTLAQVKFEPGTVATQWRPNHVRIEHANCTRYYYGGGANVGVAAAGGWAGASTTIYASGFFPVWMRATPTITPVYNYVANSQGGSATATTQSVTFSANAPNIGGYIFGGTYSASADL